MKYIYRPNPSGQGKIQRTKGYTFHQRLINRSPGKLRLAWQLPQFEMPWHTIGLVALCLVAVTGLWLGGAKARKVIIVRQNEKKATDLAQAQEQQKSTIDRLKSSLTNPQEAINYGHTKQQEGNLTEAVAAYTIALNYEPNWRDAYLCLGQVYLMQEDYANAEQALSRALALDPINVTTHNLLSLLYKKTGHAEAANTEAQKATDLAKKMGLEIGG